MYVDAGLCGKDGITTISLSYITRGADGEVLFAAATALRQQMTPLMGELTAIQDDLKVGIQRGAQSFIVETDCRRAIQLLSETDKVVLIL
uniref:RNase H type-1 domain-containing protein n=1 Tax=Cannabis sativa TaxID=3483 RepID=A0A803QSB9_CANSA